jgi:hypothetical protein
MSSALRSFSHAPSARTGSGLGTTSLHREQPTYSGYGGGSRYAGASTSGYNSSASTNGISYGSAGIGGVLPRGRTTAPMDDRAPMAGNATLTRTNHSASLAAMTPGAQRPALFDTTVSSAYGGSHTVPRARAASPAVGSRPLPSYTAPTRITDSQRRPLHLGQSMADALARPTILNTIPLQRATRPATAPCRRARRRCRI